MKVAWLLTLVLRAAGQRRGNMAVPAGTEVGPVEAGGRGVSPVLIGGGGIRTDEASVPGIKTDGVTAVMWDQQVEAEEKDNSFGESALTNLLKNYFMETTSHSDVKDSNPKNNDGDVDIRGGLGNSNVEVAKAEPASLLDDETKPFTFVDGMDRLNTVSHRLRSDKDVNPASLLVEVSDVAQALLHGLLQVQDLYEKGDEEGAVAVLRSTMGNLEYFARASRGTKIKGSDRGVDILGSSSLDHGSPYDLETISNAKLAEFLEPRVFDEQIEIIQDAVNILEVFDLSLLSPVDKHTTQENLDSDLVSAKDEYWKMHSHEYEFEPNAFDFGFARAQTTHSQSRGKFRPQQFFDHSSIQNLLHQHKMVAGNQVNAQRLRKMSSLFKNDQGVMARHELRMNALGDACQPGCSTVTCNCEKLFGCVNSMTMYDLAVLTAGGFIDRTPTSQNYANFTVSVDDLSLFDADENLGEKLARMQANAVDHTDTSKCTSVLEELYTGCEPSKTSCSNPNTESFQVSTDQVCHAVNTKTKLLFEVIGDEFDGFVDKDGTAMAKPLSFDVCREFVAAFDRLYEARDTTMYDLPNPMRKSSQALHDKTTAQIFQHTQFPLRNFFNKNLQTGIVDRTFVEVTDSRYFAIVNPASGKFSINTTQTTKAISYDGNCGEKVSMRTHDPTSELQHFKLVGDKLVPKSCSGYRLVLVAAPGSACFDGAMLRLKSASFSPADQEFRVRRDGSIVSVKCPNLAMSVIEDGTMLEVEDPSLIHVRFINPASKKVIVTNGNLLGELKLNDYGADVENQHFHINRTRSGSGGSVRIHYKKKQLGDSSSWLGFCKYLNVNACKVGDNIRLLLTEFGGYCHWIISPKGLIEPFHDDQSKNCSSKALGFVGNWTTDTRLTLRDKQSADPNQHFVPVSDEIIFRPAAGNRTQLWEFYFVDPPYDFAVLPGFPGDVSVSVCTPTVECACSTKFGDTYDNCSQQSHASGRCGGSRHCKYCKASDPTHYVGPNPDPCVNIISLDSAADKELSKSAMHSCDRSMALLLGSQMSLGTLRDIVSDVKANGAERMPGKCCFDTPTTNSDRLGFEFDPSVTTCQNPGLWHLGLSEEACNNAGGKWFRSPCVTLKECIDARPKRFDPTSPQEGTCQDVLKRLSIGFVAGRMLPTSHFTIVVPASDKISLFMTQTAKAISYEADCSEKVSLKSVSVSGANLHLQHFMPSDDGKTLVPRLCPDKRLTLVGKLGSECFDGAILRLKSTSFTSDQEFRVRVDGSIVSVKCPNLAMAAIEDDTLLEIEDPSLVTVRFYNPSSQKVIGSPNVCLSQYDSLRLQSYDPSQDQQFIVNRTGSDQSVEIISVKDCGWADKTRKAVTLSYNDDHGCPSRSNNVEALPLLSDPITRTSYSGYESMKQRYRQQWIIDSGGVIESGVAGCENKVIAVAHLNRFLGAQDKQSADPNQQFIPVSDEIIFRPAVGNNVQLWEFHLNTTWSNRVTWFNNLASSWCSNFCRSLPDHGHQVGMMTKGDKCICMYNETKVPDQVPDYATRSPPKFSLVSNGKALGLSHEVADCTADEIHIEHQDLVQNSPRQQLYLSYEGQLVSAKCPQRVFTAFGNGNLRAVAPYFQLNDVGVQQQQWVYSASSGSISNVKYPDLLISSINSGVSTLDSYFFSLVNQRTGLTLGVADDECEEGPEIQLQTEVAGGLNQKFKLGEGDKIISMMCPSYALSVSHCSEGAKLGLSENGSLNRWDFLAKNRWYFDADGKIKSLDCSDMFIGTGATSRAEFHIVTPASRVRTGSSPPAESDPQPIDESDPQPFDTPAEFENDTSTSAIPYDDATYNERQEPSVGTEMVLSSWATQDHFLTWTQRRWRFAELVGPYFFVNSGIELAMGIEEGDCIDGMTLNVQEYNQNSPFQQFYLGNHGAIYSAKCGGGVISMKGSCGEGMSLKLRMYKDEKSMKWEYKSDGLLRSAKCPDYVIGVDGDQNAVAGDEIRLTLPSMPPEKSKTWKRQNTRLLSAESSGPLWNQKWTIDFVDKDYNGSGLVGSLMGPEENYPEENYRYLVENYGYLVHCGANRPFGAETWTTGPCAAALEKKADMSELHEVRCCSDTSKNGWLRHDGCAVWAASNLPTCNSAKTHAQAEEICSDNTARLCSVEELRNNCTMHSGCSFDGEHIWSSTPVLPINCYGPNPAFSTSFEEFAKETLIDNANDEAQCQHARKQLAFDADYPYDVEVCDAFNKRMCDLEFTGVDHAMETLSGPPQFEHVEYEKVEYERVEYKEEAFEMPPEYSEDPNLRLQPFDPKKITSWEFAEDEETSDGDNPSQAGLNQVQDAMLAMQLVQHAAERAHMLVTDFDMCKAIPETLPMGWVAIPNPAFIACVIAWLFGLGTITAVLVTSEIAAEVLFIEFEKATEGPDGEVYANNASRKTYRNLKNLDAFLKDALQKTNENMKNQHTSMRKHLQDRHWALETNIRRDIFESENDLGRGIVTAQNALGQAIVDGRNANGQAIVDARNANSDQHNAISTWLHENLCIIYAALDGTCTEFIGPLLEDQTFTPMVLSWPEGQPNMIDRLEHMEVMGAGIHEAVAGIENSLTVGMSFKEGEVMHSFEAGILKHKLDELHGLVKAIEDSMTVRTDSVEVKVDAIEPKLDAVQNAMQAEIKVAENKMYDIENKLGDMENKLGDMENKLEDFGRNMDDMKNKMGDFGRNMDDMKNKIDDMTELISRVMQQNMNLMEQNMKVMEVLA